MVRGCLRGPLRHDPLHAFTPPLGASRPRDLRGDMIQRRHGLEPGAKGNGEELRGTGHDTSCGAPGGPDLDGDGERTHMLEDHYVRLDCSGPERFPRLAQGRRSRTRRRRRSLRTPCPCPAARGRASVWPRPRYIIRRRGGWARDNPIR